MANFQLDLDSHPQLCGLGGREFVDSLIDHGFVRWFGVECVSESELGLAQSAIGRLAIGFVLIEDRADALSLLGRQVKLIDRIFNWRYRGVLRVGGCSEEQESGEEDY